MPGVKKDNPHGGTEGDGPYLLVEGAGGGVFVPPPPLLWSLLLQPANTPNRPNNTIRVNNLFIVGVSFTKEGKRTSKNVN